MKVIIELAGHRTPNPLNEERRRDEERDDSVARERKLAGTLLDRQICRQRGSVRDKLERRAAVLEPPHLLQLEKGWVLVDCVKARGRLSAGSKVSRR